MYFCHRYFSNYYSQAGYSRSLLSIKKDGLHRSYTELIFQFVTVNRDFIEGAKQFKAVIEKIQTYMKTGTLIACSDYEIGMLMQAIMMRMLNNM